MKINKIAACVGLSLALVSGVSQAAPTTAAGQVTFSGAVNNSPCSISSDTQMQDVKMGSVSTQALIKGVYTPVDFKIKLVNCQAASTNVTATFTGAFDTTAKLFTGVNSGTFVAKGLGIAIKNAKGDQVISGTASDVGPTAALSNDLHFTATVMPTKLASPGAGDFTPGDFSVPVNFTLTYN